MFFFELTNVRIIGIKTLLNQAQGNWEIVRDNEKFEFSGIQINGCTVATSMLNMTWV